MAFFTALQSVHCRMMKTEYTFTTCKVAPLLSTLGRDKWDCSCFQSSSSTLCAHLASCSTPYTTSSSKHSWALTNSNSMVREFTMAEAELAKSRSPAPVQLAGYFQNSAARLGWPRPRKSKNQRVGGGADAGSGVGASKWHLPAAVFSAGSHFASRAAIALI